MSRGFSKKIAKIAKYLFLHLDGEAVAARGAFYDVLPRNARKAQGAFAVRTLAKDVRFSVTEAHPQAAEGQKQLAEKTAKGAVLTLTLCYIAREKAEERIAEEEKIERKKEEIV